MSQAKTIETVHGEVEYETATCASCGQEYQPSEMEHLHDGDVKRVKDGYSSFYGILFKKGSHKRVYFCDGCYEEPIKCSNPIFRSTTTINFCLLVAFLTGLGVGLVL